VTKRRQGRSGGWRRNVRKARHVKQGDLSGGRDGVHVSTADGLLSAEAAEEPATQESERPYER
jgi:hypothetical protein